jgi:hypothetical protein
LLNSIPHGNLPSQLDVYFPEFLSLDMKKLAIFINNCDPGEEDECKFEAITQEDNGFKLDGYAFSLGEMTMTIFLHSIKSPMSEIIKFSPILTSKLKESLMSHKAFALLTVKGGEHYLPVERIIFLYKMAGAMFEQGAIGIGNVRTRQVFPSMLLKDLFNQEVKEDETTLWDALRLYGEPFELLAVIRRIELDGKEYVCTCGYGYCGFPDFIWEYEESYAETVAEMLQSTFHYMMEMNTVIGSGHSMGYDENVAFRFQEVPEGLEIPYIVKNLLLVTREKPN